MLKVNKKSPCKSQIADLQGQNYAKPNGQLRVKTPVF